MLRTISCAITPLTLLILLLVCQVACTQTLNISTIDRGWYDATGFHDPNNLDYVVGDIRASCPSCTDDNRNFFVFDLSGVSQPIASAKLALQASNVFTADPSETYELHDVTTLITSLRNRTGGVAAWTDLGSGVVFGSRSMTEADIFTVVEIPLNLSAIAAMNSTHGLFAMGGSITTLDSLSNSEFAFGRTSSSTTELRLTLVPEPSILFLLAIGGIGLGLSPGRQLIRT
jgi:hypothetical protein